MKLYLAFDTRYIYRPHPKDGNPLIQVRSQDGGQGGTPYWNSIACACYAAGSMPLAFTQEDFLVCYCYVIGPLNDKLGLYDQPSFCLLYVLMNLIFDANVNCK